MFCDNNIWYYVFDIILWMNECFKNEKLFWKFTLLHNIHSLPVSLNDISQEIPSRIQHDHPIDNIIGQLGDGVQTRSQSGDVNTCLYSFFISQIEPKSIEMALNEPSWVDAMREELNQFEMLGVWKLVELPKGKKSLDTRWVYRNK